MKHKTSTILNEWDLLADRFNTHKLKNEVHPDAAVNIFVGWPVFIEQIKTQGAYLGKPKLEILDYGCGAGEFCNVAKELGHNVVGVDSSVNMLKIASDNVRKNVHLYHASKLESRSLTERLKGKFDVITSMHVLDWIEEPAGVFEVLKSLLNDNGIFLFAVFPKGHIKDSLIIKKLFEDFDSTADPKFGYANFDGVRVPVYVKEASYYDKYFSSVGFEKVLEYYPPYPKEFLEKYKWTDSLYPEMMILCYRKLP